MSKMLQGIGFMWTIVGVFLVIGSFGGGGLGALSAGVGMGIFPGLVLVALGHISEDVGILVQRLTPNGHVPQVHTALSPDPAPPPQPEAAGLPPPVSEPLPRARPGTRPPWEKS